MEQSQPQSREPHPLPSGGDSTVDFGDWRTFVKELKGEWKQLWWTRIDDEVRAEGIASDEYPKLFVDKGTIIIATRDYKPPSFHEILKMHMPEMIAGQVDLSPSVGGLGRFIREAIAGQRVRRREHPPKPKRPKSQQQKHGGRGWLHYSME